MRRTVRPATGRWCCLSQENPRFGKGRAPAGLNFGDCFAYALAQATGRPLLFKGTDLELTDARPAATSEPR